MLFVFCFPYLVLVKSAKETKAFIFIYMTWTVNNPIS